MVLRIFGCQHCTEGETTAGMCIMSDGDQILLAIIADGMDAWHLITADAIDGKH